ncbi:MAG: ribosome maturation factor RimP [Clostridia bacterium]|nr:ribosome maturation factor RimP [Clostridia bacterium]
MAKGNRPEGGVAAVCRELAQPFADQLGLSIWDVRFVKEGADWYLRVIIDKPEGVDINDCVDMTHLLSPALDKADPIAQSYCLEVMSPGIERELTRPEHFEAFEGEPVTVRLIRPDENGEREIVGILLGTPDGNVALQTEDDQTRVFSRKDIAAVHAVDLWDDSEETITEE